MENRENTIRRNIHASLNELDNTEMFTEKREAPTNRS